jgi:hypothetical protein
MSPARKIALTPERIIRDPEFAKRLDSACTAGGQCPPLHKGRLTWVQNELKRRFKEEVSVETVRKWFAGEAKPRQDKVAMLAELLQVDMSWLSLGVDKGLAPREAIIKGREIRGAVNLVAGLIEMDGGHAAFASEVEQKRGVDLHAIIKGAKYDFAVVVAEDGVFRVPVSSEAVVLGTVKRGFTFEIYEIPESAIERGSNRGGMVEVKTSAKGLRRIQTFAQRLG